MKLSFTELKNAFDHSNIVLKKSYHECKSDENIFNKN